MELAISHQRSGIRMWLLKLVFLLTADSRQLTANCPILFKREGVCELAISHQRSGIRMWLLKLVFFTDCR